MKTFEERDEFRRRPIAEKLIRLLMSDVDISPMVINGQWGTGKTEFCEKLRHLLKQQYPDVKVAYIDAFRADHADEPLLTMVAALADLMEDREAQSFKEKAIPVLRYGLKAVAKGGLAWVLRQNVDEIPDGLEEVVKNTATEGVDALIDQCIRDHRTIGQAVEGLKEILEEIANEHPLIVFIDELDRCRPDFAVSMLENIKHVFEVSNVQFVLVCNIDQLQDAVNHCYGSGVNSRRYLDKFFKYSLSLPDEIEVTASDYRAASVEHARLLIDASSVLTNDGLIGGDVFEFIKVLICRNTLSLREVETFVRYMEIAAVMRDGNKPGQIPIFGEVSIGILLLQALGVYLYCFDAEASIGIMNSSIPPTRVTEAFGVSSVEEMNDFTDYPSVNQALAFSIIFDGNSHLSSDSAVLEKQGLLEDHVEYLFNRRGRGWEDGWFKSVIQDVVRALRFQ